MINGKVTCISNFAFSGNKANSASLAQIFSPATGKPMTCDELKKAWAK